MSSREKRETAMLPETNSPSNISDQVLVDCPTPSNASSLTPTIALAVGVAAPLVLAGCGGGGGGGDAPAVPESGGGVSNPNIPAGSDPGDIGGTPSTTFAIKFTGISVRATSSNTAAVITTNGTAQNGDRAVYIGFNTTTKDTGKQGPERSHTFLTKVAGGTIDKEFTVTINPTANKVLNRIPTPTFNAARHVASRMGFGPSMEDILNLAQFTNINDAVDHLVDTMTTEAFQKTLPWTGKPAGDISNLGRRWELQAWWVKEIVKTPCPFTERMTLFWSNHFVINTHDTYNYLVSHDWLTFLRKNASGNLRKFVHDMCLQPAMLMYLDNDKNRRTRAPGAPKTAPENTPSNENFGRELLELFTLGVGYIYNENDVIEVSRAFTGHNLSNDAYTFFPDRHDTGNMTIMNEGPKNFGGTAGNVYDIIDVILAQKVNPTDTFPRTARLITEKMWAEFIGTPIEDNSAAINSLAEVLYGGGTWELKPFYKAFFKRPEFLDPSLDRKLLKSPIDMICGFYRTLNLEPFLYASETDGWARWIRAMKDCGDQEQEPLAPPIVKGWLGGLTWINSKTLLERFSEFGGYGGRIFRNQNDSFLSPFLTGITRDKLSSLMLGMPPLTQAALDGPPVGEKSPLIYTIKLFMLDPAFNTK
jgi:uncharacterized protein (DUF1800 family)